MADRPFHVLGHRGCRGRKGIAENSLAAFQVALKEGADGLELDVFKTADHQPQLVVFHDDNLDDLSDGKGPIVEKTWDELKEFWLRDKTKGELTRHKIPTLDQVLQLVEKFRNEHPDDERTKNFLVSIEIKDATIARPVAETIKKRLAKTGLQQPWGMGNFEVRSFIMDTLKEIKKPGVLPEVALGLLFEGMPSTYPWDIPLDQLKANLAKEDIKALMEQKTGYGPVTVGITLPSLTDEAIAAIKAAGARVEAWTAGETRPDDLQPADRQALLTKLATNDIRFVTDFPGEIAKLADTYRGWGTRTIMEAEVPRSAVL